MAPAVIHKGLTSFLPVTDIAIIAIEPTSSVTTITTTIIATRWTPYDYHHHRHHHQHHQDQNNAAAMSLWNLWNELGLSSRLQRNSRREAPNSKARWSDPACNCSRLEGCSDAKCKSAKPDLSIVRFSCRHPFCRTFATHDPGTQRRQWMPLPAFAWPGRDDLTRFPQPLGPFDVSFWQQASKASPAGPEHRSGLMHQMQWPTSQHCRCFRRIDVVATKRRQGR